MQDNSFKKNIAQELHGLSIEPSQKVWLAVEKELDKDKGPYFPVWWWLFFLLIGGAGLLWFTGKENKKEITSANKKTMPVVAQQKAAAGITTAPVAFDIALTEKPALPAPGQSTAAKDISAGVQTKHIAGRTTIKITGAATGEKGHASRQPLTDKAKQKISIAAPGMETNSNEQEIAPVNEEGRPTILTATIPTAQDSAKTIGLVVKEEKKQAPADTVPASVPLTQKKKQWIKEWSVAVGQASLISINLYGGKKNEFSNISTGNPTPADPTLERNGYTFRQGSYWQAGINIGRPLSKKISWLTGLHYNFQQVNIDRKLSVDSFWLNGTGVYTTISTNLYKEKMAIHNINIPLLLKFTASRNFDINAGIYNNILISSNQDKYAALLGRKKTYQAMLHVNPSFLVKKFSVGPFVNIGLQQYAIQKNLVNYGLQLKYVPKK